MTAGGVSLTTLMNERMAIGGSIATGFPGDRWSWSEEPAVCRGLAVDNPERCGRGSPSWYGEGVGASKTHLGARC